MGVQIKLAVVERTSVLFDGKRNEIIAYRLDNGFAAKWVCATCGSKGELPKAPSDSILQAFNDAKIRFYKHCERMHQVSENR